MREELQQQIVPVPDPTILTTQSLFREIAALKELVSAQIAATANIFEERIKQVIARTDEIFARIDVQFIERDKRTEQLSIASSTAIAAALQAAKEAVGAQNTSNAISITKSETSMLESLRQLRDLFQADSRATNDKINDIKSRIDKGEGKNTGVSTVWASVLGGGSFLIALITVGILLVRFH